MTYNICLVLNYHVDGKIAIATDVDGDFMRIIDGFKQCNRSDSLPGLVAKW
jgi:hypothetical protein